MSEPTPQSLNEREREIIQLIADGLSNDQIAQRLSISLNTVKWYLKHIYAVLDVKRRTQAVAAARSRGLLDGDSPPGPTLPIPPTTFIGRQKELAQVLELLDDSETRLVSIVGPGGIGKTRLALAAAAQFQANRQLPVHFVALEGVQQAEGVVPAIAGTIGFQFGGQQDLRQQLITGLSNRAMLLVLDNCEHVLDAMTVLVDMLAVAPTLKILTTSRERLNLQSETLFHLDGLTYPTQPQTALEFEAIRLFLQTVHRQRPEFEPSTDDWLPISRICELVEGMPLALELAAGWIDVLSPEEIADSLQQDIRFLKTSARDVPARHRSMTAVFEQSWQLMSESEQNVFKKLSVFRGGFDRAAAEAVAGATPDILKELLAKSRISEVQSGRWKLHELLRQFAEEKLRNEPAEYEQIVYAHCQYYGHLMKQFGQLHETDLANFSAKIVGMQWDFENILAGWHTALQRPFVSEIGNYLNMLTLLFAGRGLLYQAKSMLDEAQLLYDSHPGDVQELDRVLMLTYRGWFTFALSRLDEARSLLERADQLSTHPNVRGSPQLGLLWSFLGWTIYLQDDVSTARAFLQQSIDHCRKTNFAFGTWSALGQLGMIEFIEDNYEAANWLFNETLLIAQQNSFTNGIVWVSSLLGNVRYALGHYQAAYHLWRETLESYRKTMLFEPVLLVIIGIAMLFKQHNQSELALDFLALVIYHPQCQLATRHQALHIFEKLRHQLSVEHIHAVMEKAKQGQLSTPYFDSNFVIDHALIDTLLMLLDEFAPEDEE